MHLPSEEDAFQAKLDADPGDHFTRLVFADWLDEHDDPRAPGYRVLAGFKFRPYEYLPIVLPPAGPPGRPAECGWGVADNLIYCDNKDFAEHLLPRVWFNRLGGGSTGGRAVAKTTAGMRAHWWRRYPTRRVAEDAAALAFALIPPKTRGLLRKRAAAGHPFPASRRKEKT